MRCGARITQGGRRCHECVVEIGQAAAKLLGAGVTLADVCKHLDYPSAEGLHLLAVKYGGYAESLQHAHPADVTESRRLAGRAIFRTKPACYTP